MERVKRRKGRDLVNIVVLVSGAKDVVLGQKLLDKPWPQIKPLGAMGRPHSGVSKGSDRERYNLVCTRDKY